MEEEEGIVREMCAHSHRPNNTDDIAISHTQTMVANLSAEAEQGWRKQKGKGCSHQTKETWK